ncbi:hypothetical protein V1509DRAFT_517341 [Lipomyces kononenkoae]
MPAITRQKACMARADSKRRCDKQLPACQRCLDRDVDCVYLQPKRQRRDPIPIACHTRSEDFPAPETHGDAEAFESSLDFVDWRALEAADLDLSLSDVIIPYIQPLSVSAASVPTHEVAFESGNVSSTRCPRFLRDETWAMRHCNREVVCATGVELEPFIRAVEEMLQSWVKNGCNSFMHRRLYEKGMPTCLQDAFTTLATYTGRTPAVKETILQIVEERTSALASQSPPTAGGAQGILAHLGRVQALFVYEFIGLFDGSVRLRASAEKHIPTLRRWVIRM